MIKKILLASIAAILLFFNVAAAQYSPISDNENVYYYSYLPALPQCRLFFKQYGVVEKFNIVKKEVSQSPSNAKEFYDLCGKNVPPEEMGVPYLHLKANVFPATLT